jgi:DMSO/TMAO reductase YedYZ heme-binding membrane subunit
MLVAMVVTSHLGIQKRVGPAWRKLHAVGVHLQWGAFAGALPFSVAKQELVAWPLLALTLLAAALRAFA